MKSIAVDTVTSNEQYVRMRIFDGDLLIDEAGAELLRIEREQNDCLRAKVAELYAELLRAGPPH